MLVSRAKAARALGVSGTQFSAMAERCGVRCISSLFPRNYYSSSTPGTRGSVRYLLKDVLDLIDKLYSGDKRLLNSVKHNLAKSSTSIKGMTILKDEHHLLDELVKDDSVD